VRCEEKRSLTKQTMVRVSRRSVRRALKESLKKLLGHLLGRRERSKMYPEIRHKLKVWESGSENTIIDTSATSTGLAMSYYVLELQMEELKAKVDPVELEEVYEIYKKKGK